MHGSAIDQSFTKPMQNHTDTTRPGEVTPATDHIERRRLTKSFGRGPAFGGAQPRVNVELLRGPSARGWARLTEASRNSFIAGRSMPACPPC